MYIIELETASRRKKKPKYLIRRGFPDPKIIKETKTKVRYRILADEDELNKYLKKARKYKFEYSWYDERYKRSSNYRKGFFDENPPPYRCRYCNRRLSAENVVIDHLVPVDAAKKSGFAQWLLNRNGCESVNDTANLVPACAKCNRKKSNSMAMWYIRGILGKHKIYWFIKYTIQIIWSAAIASALLYALLYLLGYRPDLIFLHILDKVKNITKNFI